jgi:ribosome-associated protein
VTSALIVNSRWKIPLREFQFTFVRSSGPGGQNVNKVASKATLRWNVVESPSVPPSVKARFVEQYRRRITSEGYLIITSQRYREAGKNEYDCLEKLRRMLAEAAVTAKPRKPTRPTRGSVQRRLDQKRKTAQKKSLRRSAPDE